MKGGDKEGEEGEETGEEGREGNEREERGGKKEEGRRGKKEEEVISCSTLLRGDPCHSVLLLAHKSKIPLSNL